MHGLLTMHKLNQRNAEAERILRQYAKQDGRTIPETQDRTAKEQKQEPTAREIL